jgi:hypothetical protein
MKTKQEIKKQTRRIKRKRKIERVAKKKAALTKPSKGLRIVQQVFKTIGNEYPALFDIINEIEDYRKKSNYELAELIMACVAMFIFFDVSRNAFNNDRIEVNSKEITKGFLNCVYLTWIPWIRSCVNWQKMN